MAGERTDWAVGLQDETSGAAESAAGALLRLKATMDDGQASLKEMQSQMRMLKSATTPNAQAMQDLADRMAVVKSQIGSASAAFVNMGGSAKAVSVAQQQLAAASTQAVSGLTPEAAAALAVDAAAKKASASLQAMAAAAALNKSKFDYAANSQRAWVKSVDEGVMAKLQKPIKLPSLDGVNKAFKEMEAAAVPAAKKTGDALKEGMDVTKAALGPMGGLFEKVSMLKGALGGVSSGELAVAGGSAAMAIGAAAVTVAFVSLLATAGILVYKLAELAVTLNKKAMERLNKSITTSKENFAKLFSGVRVEKFVGAVEKVLGLLDENQASAKALKTLLSTLLNPLFDAAAYVGPFVRNVFRGMVIGALLIAIGVLKARNALLALIPPEVIAMTKSLVANINWVWVGVGVGIALVGILALALVVLTVAFFALAAVIFILNIPLMILIALLIALIAIPVLIVVGIVLLIAYMGELMSYLADLGSAGAEAASNLISGLVGGIMSGAGAVFDAIKGLASGAIGTLKAALGIASPSKIFAGLGDFTAQGFAAGVEGGTPAVQSSVEGMATGAVGAAAGGGSRASGAGSKASVVIPLTVKGPPAYQASVRDEYQRLAQTLESGLNMVGYPVAIEVT